jgi:hypothetical protein
MSTPNRALTILYFIVIAAAWALLSDSDYSEARRVECGNRSSAKYLVTWNPSTDRCEKEVRNGTTSQNR